MFLPLLFCFVSASDLCLMHCVPLRQGPCMCFSDLLSTFLSALKIMGRIAVHPMCLYERISRQNSFPPPRASCKPCSRMQMPPPLAVITPTPRTGQYSCTRLFGSPEAVCVIRCRLDQDTALCGAEGSVLGDNLIPRLP